VPSGRRLGRCHHPSGSRHPLAYPRFSILQFRNRSTGGSGRV